MWFMPLIPALWRQRWAVSESEASLVYKDQDRATQGQKKKKKGCQGVEVTSLKTTISHGDVRAQQPCFFSPRDAD